MFEVGRLCVKLAGRDAGKKCVIVDIIDSRFVMIDGETRRRKCNLSHLEPLTEMIKIKKGADHKAVAAELKKLGIDARETKPKKAAEKPMKIRKQKTAEEKEAVNSKKAKKEEKKPQEKKPAKEDKADKKETKEDKPKAAAKKPSTKKEVKKD